MAPQDWHRLRAAEGWIGLGDAASASRELAEISPSARSNPAVLCAHYQLHAHTGNWNAAADLAGRLSELLPDEPAPWLWLAYAVRRKTGGGVGPARDTLLRVEPKFPSRLLFPFNLACYCAQLGEYAEAERWLRKAAAVDAETVRELAREEADLKPLWEHLGGMLWDDKRTRL